MKPTLKSAFGAMFDNFGTLRAASAGGSGREAAAHLAALFLALKIDLVVDVGAQSGEFGAFLREQVGYAGRIVSFEAIPEPFNALKLRAAEDPMWEVEQASLGSTGGQLPLNVIDLRDFRPPEHGKPVRPSPRGFLRRTMRVRREVVPIRTLDEALPPLAARLDARRIFLRLNAADCDREVLRGGEKSLGKIAALQTELSTTRRAEGMPHYLAMLSFLEAKHFSPNGFFPIRSRVTAPAAFDVCLVNSAYA